MTGDSTPENKKKTHNHTVCQTVLVPVVCWSVGISASVSAIVPNFKVNSKNNHINTWNCHELGITSVDDARDGTRKLRPIQNQCVDRGGRVGTMAIEVGTG